MGADILNNIMDIGSMYGIKRKYNTNNKKLLPIKTANNPKREMIINNNAPYLLRSESEMNSEDCTEKQNNIDGCMNKNVPLISQEFIKKNMLSCYDYDMNRKIMWKDMNSYVATQIGRIAELEFFIGNETTSKIGYITFVGENYIIIRNQDLGESILCRCDDIKFITFYD